MSQVAVVLAAGGGSRFAGPDHKLASLFRGAPLWRWAVRTAVAAELDHVVVVTGGVALGEEAPEFASATFLPNPRWAEGMATSLQVAVRWATERGCNGLVVALADQPLITADAWRAVAATTSAPIAVATYAGHRGHPVRIAQEAWPLLPVHGDEGARSVMKARPDFVVEVACAGDPADVDTSEDLARLGAGSSASGDGRPTDAQPICHMRVAPSLMADRILT
jgi:molybdenum cofactor cytidylyltransferase